MIYAEGRRFPNKAAYNAHLKQRADEHAAAQARERAAFEARNTVRARNATTHGLFARDIVLPHLGEDPKGYEALMAEFNAQIGPKNLLERHYTEKIAAASWRLRRLHRWQAQLFEDPDLTEDERLDKLDKVLRHETALHRQIDSAVKMLCREVPRLFEGRPGGSAPCPPDGFDSAALDNTAPDAPAPQICQNENGQNEPAPDTHPSPCSDGVPTAPAPQPHETVKTNPPLPPTLTRFGGGGAACRDGGGSCSPVP